MKKYYVYKYIDSSNKNVFYIGKGIGDRAYKGTRNSNCEAYKEVVDEWEVVIDSYFDNEDECLNYEMELIQKHIKAGHPITNIMGVDENGSINTFSMEKIGEIKYLLFLIENGVINMTDSNIYKELNIHYQMLKDCRDCKYDNVTFIIPDNIEDIISIYHVDSYHGEELKIANLKYLLELNKRGVIKATNKSLGDEFGISNSLVGYYEKGKSRPDIPPIKPNNLHYILEKYNPQKLTKEQIKWAMAKWIWERKEVGTFKMTNRNIADILEINYSSIGDISRRETISIKPTQDVICKLYAYIQ